jgi:hypothetical protein
MSSRVLLALPIAIAILAQPLAAQAAPARFSHAPLTAALGPASGEEEPEEGEEEGEGGSAGGEGEEETEDGTPAACLLEGADASIVASIPHRTVRLTVDYSAYEPAVVKLDYWLEGGRGTLRFGIARWRISTQGRFTSIAHLGESETARVRAARVFVVRVEPPGVPSYCESYLTRRLTAKREEGGRESWSELREGGSD